MREFRFRIWDKEEGVIKYSPHFSVNAYGDLYYCGVHYWYRYLIQQYTGVKDTNGDKIYEGDILQIKSKDGTPYNEKVVFKDGAFCLKVKLEGFEIHNLDKIKNKIEYIPLKSYAINGKLLAYKIVGNIMEGDKK